jgi:hypothetical protein
MPEPDKVQQSITTPVIDSKPIGEGDSMPGPQVTSGKYLPPLPSPTNDDDSGLRVHKELGLYQRMTTERWPISIDQRERCISRVMHLLETSRDARAIAKAALVLAKLDEINLTAQRDEKPMTPAVNINLNTPRDLSGISDAELEARLQALETTKPGG